MHTVPTLGEGDGARSNAPASGYARFDGELSVLGEVSRISCDGCGARAFKDVACGVCMYVCFLCEMMWAGQQHVIIGFGRALLCSRT